MTGPTHEHDALLAGMRSCVSALRRDGYRGCRLTPLLAQLIRTIYTEAFEAGVSYARAKEVAHD